MPLPVIAGVSRVTFKWLSDANGGNAVNVMHFRRDGSPTNELWETLLGRVDQPMWNHTTNPQGIYEVDITALDGFSATEVHPTSPTSQWTGGAGSGSMIPAACALVKVTTDFRGPSARGRIFLPYVAEGCQTDGTLESSTIESMQTAWDDFRQGMEDDLWPMVVASYVHESSHLCSAVYVEGQLATQRRRQSR